MLSTLYRTIRMKISSHVYLSISKLKYHNSSMICSPNTNYPILNKNEEIKILDIINKGSSDDLKKYSIKESELKKLLIYREKNGEFKTLDDILITQNVSSFIKLCKSILIGEKNIEKSKSTSIVKKRKKSKSTNTYKSLVTPAIDKSIKNNINKILGLHVFGNHIYWAMIDENKILSNWDCTTFENPSKTSLVPLINLMINIISQLPNVDAYVMECDRYALLSKLKTTAYAFYLQRQQIITMIISILETRRQINNDNTSAMTNFYMLQAHASARQFNLTVGSEIISAKSVISDILSGLQMEYNHLLSSVDDNIISRYSSREPAIREQLNTVLLITLTFKELLNKI